MTAIANAVLHERDPANPEGMIPSAASVSAELMSEDAIAIWATKQGDEGFANPGIELSAVGAIRLGEKLIELGREGAQTVEALKRVVDSTAEERDQFRKALMHIAAMSDNDAGNGDPQQTARLVLRGR